jgi:hypothetical protein
MQKSSSILLALTVLAALGLFYLSPTADVVPEELEAFKS